MHEKDLVLKVALAEIINGYSTSTTEKFGKIFIKHFSNVDNAEIEQEYSRIYHLALESSLPTFEKREEEILLEGFWTKEKNSKLNELEKLIPNLKITKSKLFREVDIQSVQKQIDDTEKEILTLKIIKNSLIGVTAESFANKKVNEFFIYQALFKDGDFKNKIFSDEEYNELDVNEIQELVNIYNSTLEKFNEKNIKKIAISPQFSNAFYLSNDDPYIFYGKPIIHLTFYQIDLFAHSKYFKSMIQNSAQKVPPEVMSDPDKLIEWFNATQTAEKLIDEAEKSLAKSGKESGGGGIAIVGASSTDIKKLGIANDGNSNLMKLAKEKGGSLNFEDIIRAQNI